MNKIFTNRQTAVVLLLSLLLIVPSSLSAEAVEDIPDEERTAIEQTAMDYGDGFYSGAPERMARAIHPDLNKVFIRFLPQTKKSFVSYSSYSILVEATRAEMGLTPPEKRKITVEALLMNGDVACAKFMSAQYNDFLQMVKIDGQWKIVNVLWFPGPDSRGRILPEGFDQDKERESAVKTALDYIQGAQSGDVARLESALHPEACRAVYQKIPKTGGVIIQRNRFSGLVEPVRAGMGVVPEDKRQAETRVIDMMDAMAFLEVSTHNAFHYIQMQWMEGRWKIFNILVLPKPGTP